MFFTFGIPQLPIILVVIVIGIIQFIRNLSNKSNKEKFATFESNIITVTNIAAIYLIIMAIFRGSNEGLLIILGIGVNIILFMLYISIIKALILFKGKYDYSEVLGAGNIYEESMAKIKQNRKIGFWSLVAVAVLYKMIIMKFLIRSSFVMIFIISIFLLLVFIEYLYTKNISCLGKVSSDSNKIYHKYPIMKKGIMGICIVLSIFIINVDKVNERPLSKEELQVQQNMIALFGEDGLTNIQRDCNHLPHVNLDELMQCLDDNEFIDIEEDKISEKKNYVEIKKGKSKIKIVELGSSEEADNYCTNNYEDERRFFIGNHAIIEIKNKNKDFLFDDMANLYLKNY